MKTEQWWWSIEKNGKEFLTKRSENSVSRVRDFVNQGERIRPVIPLSYGEGRKSIKDLIAFVYRENDKYMYR